MGGQSRLNQRRLNDVGVDPSRRSAPPPGRSATVGSDTSSVQSPPPSVPSATTTSILPRRIVVRLAVTGFVLSIVILVLVVSLGLFHPETLANPTTRFLLLVLIALNFAVFFFV